MHKTSFVSFKNHKNKNIYYHFKKHEQLLALMLEKNKYQSFNNLGNEAEINLYFDLTFRAYALPKLKTTYSNISSLKFFIQKNKE
jgi:hypothetical protein